MRTSNARSRPDGPGEAAGGRPSRPALFKGAVAARRRAGHGRPDITEGPGGGLRIERDEHEALLKEKYR
ncbi:hypothetical protein HDA32_000462 [Spinactinospora alkalitolerans]|uniref:Uncharacterized protein n=1 Tax=Spinactinospora alkalitolerans TaxID=687207 RepID=A0A852TR84_9ACTN|nr:hypothetical protein [Spinactinospora alkalitolerans]NYE45342.1 hypothetical protein [Spinactinospora alkalitolerans]